MNNVVQIYVDGACSGNPGPGGWGALLRYGQTEKAISGGESHTTNNRMELMAAIMALSALNKSSKVEIYTDSVYVQKGITQWIHGWKKRGWKNAQNKPIMNADLWDQLDKVSSLHKIEWYWVKGHSGHKENEYVDELARTALLAYKD